MPLGRGTRLHSSEHVTTIGTWTDDSPHGSAFAVVNGVRLQYLDWGGGGDPLVLVHGLGDSPHLFDDLAPLLPIVRSSPAALLVISDVRATRLAIPTFEIARVGWQERFGRTTGWTSLVAARALFHFAALGAESRDLGMRSALLDRTG